MATSGSLRQSPPPVTQDRAIPNAALISPPESVSSASDDEDGPSGRGRQVELERLKDAVSQITQRRGSSPNKHGVDRDSLPSQKARIASGIHQSFSTGALNELANGGKRRISHTRSGTEPNVLLSKPSETSSTASEEDSDGEMQRKPQMVRKKSGELVRPALRLGSRRRPSSMPGTPTYSKAVHFDSHLEHVRHFLQVDRPLAVSAGSSPVDNYDSDAEYPFPGGDRSETRSPPYEWEIIMTNFPVDSQLRKSLPIRLDKVWLSSDQKSLLGSVIVANLAFHKTVTCRFTLDYWKTTSEIAAEYAFEVKAPGTTIGHDQFTFTIKLSDLAHLETKTLYFCVRYNVNGHEYWDNNNNANFQIDFRKKHLPQSGKNGLGGASSRPVNALPRSTRRANPSTAARPKSMPMGFDDFGDQSYNFDRPVHEYLGESGPTALRLKSNKSTGNLPSDNLSSRLSTPSGQAFANRYDFGASLTAAVQAAKDSIINERHQDGLYMRSHRRATPSAGTAKPGLRPTVSDPTGAGTKPDDPKVPGTGSPNSSLASSSYEELVNKYCFVCTPGLHFSHTPSTG
jgi:hypothetical protein